LGEVGVAGAEFNDHFSLSLSFMVAVEKELQRAK
jgi:hypothetical protein